MNISVIIPTYQGANKISNCIDALLDQSNTNFEIIIAIDGSTDHTESVASKKLENFPHYKIVKQDNKGRSSIRNLGAHEANGDLLIFYDDDMRPFPDSIEKHKIFHLKKTNQVIQGVIVSDEKKITSEFQRYKCDLEKKWEKELITQGIDQESPYLSAAHFSISKEIFNKVNGFDEKLTDAEDFDLSIKLIESGYEILYDYTNMAYHDDYFTLKSYIHRKREYTQSHEKLKSLYPDRYLKYPQRIFVPRTGWKSLIYKMLSSKKLVDMIDNESSFILMAPKKIRYKLYDLIVQGLSNYYPHKKL